MYILVGFHDDLINKGKFQVRWVAEIFWLLNVMDQEEQLWIQNFKVTFYEIKMFMYVLDHV